MEVYVSSAELEKVIGAIRKEFNELVILKSLHEGIITQEDSPVQLTYKKDENKLVIKDPFAKGQQLSELNKIKLLSLYIDALVRLLKTYPNASQESIITGYVTNKGTSGEQIFEVIILYNPKLA